jgi:hypothetical protein
MTLGRLLPAIAPALTASKILALPSTGVPALRRAIPKRLAVERSFHLTAKQSQLGHRLLDYAVDQISAPETLLFNQCPPA